ncbi:MAG: T9SS type A sorting domain-containing protein [Muribaculaceae bacterium]|nr:T9SS type A sorting domain-containing protein [Muribaculaceae bacterium]
MKTTLLTGAFIALSLGVALPSIGADMVSVPGVVKGLSPNGEKVVGNQGLHGEAERYVSYLYTVKTKATDWLTKYQETNLLASGQMVAVNDLGHIAGNILNPEMRLPVEQGGEFRPGIMKANEAEVGAPLRSGAVWRNGKTYVLGTGYHKVDEFSQEDDGSEAVGITADGNTVYGNIVSALLPVTACKWTYNPATDSYDYSEFEMGNTVVRSVITNVAENGTAIGFVRIQPRRGSAYDQPAYWTPEGELVPINIPNVDRADYYWEAMADAVSPDGRYVAVRGGGAHRYFGILDITTGELKDITLPDDTFEIVGNAVTNSGDIYCTVESVSDHTAVPYLYKTDSGLLTDFHHYLAAMDSELSSRFSGTVAGVSGDGLTLIGRSGSQYSVSSWLITLDAQQETPVSVPVPRNVNLIHSALDKLTVTWDGIQSLADGLKLNGYDVYVDGDYIETVTAEGLGGNFKLTVPGDAGLAHDAYVVTSVNRISDDREFASPNSVVATTYVSAQTELLGFESFDDARLDSQNNVHPVNDYWTAECPYGNDAFMIYWHLNVGNDYVNRSPIYMTYSINEEPWSSRLISRYHDATEAGEFYLDFMTKMKLLNEADQDLFTDYLDVEATEDGENWIMLKRIKAVDMQPGAWTNVHIDLGEQLAGKMFRVRFNAHGEGSGQLAWQLDNINFADELSTDAPEGLRGHLTSNGDVALAWHNTIGTNEVSYIYNSSYVSDYALGNDGIPMIAAVKLTPEMLEPYVGEYISGISSFIFDDPALEVANPTRAEVMVIAEDNTVLSRSDIYSEFNEICFETGWLEDAVKIEPGKSYLAAVRIYDYHRDQTPLYYQSINTFKPGFSDLFSEDDGETWQLVSEQLPPMSAEDNSNVWCVWPIRALITPEPLFDVDLKHDATLTHYVVARDGEVISKENIYESTPAYVDHAAPLKAEYAVRAYYSDGTVTEFSAPLAIDFTGIGAVEGDAGVSLKQVGGAILIEGEFDRADIIDMTGRKVISTKNGVISTSGLSTGAYIVSVSKEGARSIFKVIVK